MGLKNIYTSGGISGLDYDLAYNWRKKLKDDLWGAANVFNPMDHFKIGKCDEAVAMKYDLYRLRTSDIVVVNFNSENSIGTISELAIAYEYKIPIIALNEDHKDLHPWLEMFCDVIFDDYDAVVDHIRAHYICKD